MNCANHPDRERVAFCQNCGKPLCEECKRVDGNSIFCEQCFAMRGVQAPPYSSGPYAPPPAGYVPGGPLPRRPAEPVLAGLLGLIPGVGAMYNEQFAKGIVHLVVFAILVSLANDVNGIFGIFIGGWVLYMAFEAYHTARARRDGTPLPNPFGLNDLGDRMGFGNAWPGSHTPYGGSSVPPYDPAAQGQAQGSAHGTVPPQAGPVSQNPEQTWAAPGGAYFHRGADGSQTYSTPAAFFHRGADGTESYGVPSASHWGAPYDVPPAPPVPPVPPVSPHRHIPTGAVWLIALGVFFLVGHAPVFRVFHGRLFGPIVLIAIGIWVFVRRMMETGHSMEDDGSDFYRWRLTHAFNRAAWLILIGVLWLLDALHVFYWSHSWPVLLIAGGVLMIFRRTIFSPGYGPVPPYGAVPAGQPPAAPVTSTEIVPVDPAHFTRDDHNDHEEGR